MQIDRLRVTSLVATSSLSYVRQIFELNQARRPLLNVQLSDLGKAPPVGVEIINHLNSEHGGGWFTDHYPLIREAAPAQVTFTSGTEGPPKGIVLTYANLADTADRIISQMELTADVREYVGVPVTYSFGMARIRAISAVNGRSYIPNRGFDPFEFARMLKSGEVNALSAVPTLLRILLQSSDVIGDIGTKLRWLEIGSQHMSAAEKKAIRDLFPNARIIQHYGLTEASRSTFLQICSVPEGLLDSVGVPVGETQIAISEDGRIRIRGPHVARKRIEDGQLRETCDADGWFQTSDLGYMHGGYLFFDGRADDLINVGGVKINPDQVETRIRERFANGGKFVVAKVPDALRGDGILVATECIDADVNRLHQLAIEVLKEVGLEARSALHVWHMSTLPVTPTGKPMRREVAKAYAKERESFDVAPNVRMAAGEDSPGVMSLFRSFFVGKTIRPIDSFDSLGGDSLNYIQFSMAFEKRFGSLPSGWHTMSVVELQNSVKTTVRSIWRQTDSATITRAFFMTCIVALHLNAFVYSENWGAAYFLYMLAGYSIIRFQWPEINRTGSVKTILNTVFRIAVPTILVTVFMQLWAHKFEPKPLLLISNFFDASTLVTYYYFAEIYIQLLLLAALMFSITAFRRKFRENALLLSAVFASVTFVDGAMMERLWDTTYIYHRSPHWYAWTFALGMMIASVRGINSRIFAMVMVCTLVFNKFGWTSAAWYVCGGCALLVFVPELKLPAPLKIIVSELAASSMFMYLSHYQVNNLVTNIFHEPAPWVALFSAVVFGIVFARAYGTVERFAMAFFARHSNSASA